MNDSHILMDYSHDLLAVIDFSGSFNLFNRAFQRALSSLGLKPENMSLMHLFVPSERESMRAAVETLSRGHPVIEQLNHIDAPETPIPIRWSAFPSLEKETIYFVGNFIELEIGTEKRLRFALDIAPVAMLVTKGQNSQISMANDLFTTMFGYGEHEVINKSIEMLLPDKYRSIHVRHREAYLERPNLRPMGTGKVFYGQRKNGEVFPMDIGLNPLDGAKKDNIVVCSLVDVTQREAIVSEIVKRTKRLREELAQMETLASTDELTGVYNRRALTKQMHLHLLLTYDKQQPLSIAIMDIDYFKNINDQHGHLIGDEVLQIFVRIIQSQIRKADILARYGGDEFVIIMPNTTSEHAYSTLERIRQSVEAHDWPVKGITTSIGYTTYHPRPDDIPTALLVNEILLEADVALYQAKQGGRNRVKRYTHGEIRP